MTFEEYVTAVMTLAPDSVEIVSKIPFSKILTVAYNDSAGDSLEIRLSPTSTSKKTKVILETNSEVVAYVFVEFAHWLAMVATLTYEAEVV